MEKLQTEVNEAIRADPAVESLGSYIGAGYGWVLSNGTALASLKPPGERPGIQAVIERLRTRLARITGIRAFFTPMQDLQLGTQNSASRYQYTLTGPDPAELFRWADMMRRRMQGMHDVLTDVIANNEETGLEAGIELDRVRAAALGITPVAVDNTLYDAFGQREIRTIYLPHNYSRVIMEVNPAQQTDPSVFNQIYVPGSGTGAVPLAALMRPRRAHGAVWMAHLGQYPAVTISFDMAHGVSLGQAIAAIRKLEVEMHLPGEIRADFRGEAGEATKSGAREAMLFAAAVFAVYVVLGVLYESTVHPFTILMTLPSAIFGALLALWLTGTQFTIITSIGCILLVGMVMKNAIMMVDFALDAERREGMAPRQAIRLAAELRARPILMTTLVAILTALPLALGTGPGFEIRQPLGIAMVGGLAASQILTLTSTPVIYLLMDRLRPRRRSAPVAA
jgi:multidrug efflux pump subunit AcrB